MKLSLPFARPGSFDRESREELEAHIAEKADDLVESGMPEREARAQARREFGNPTLCAEAMREVWGWTSLDVLGQDVRQGLRAMRRNPGSTAVAVLSLALGIAANSTIFSAIHAVWLRPLPFSESDRLALIFETRQHRLLDFSGQPAVATVWDWQKQNHVFEDIGLVVPTVNVETLTGLAQRNRWSPNKAAPICFPCWE